MSDAGQVTATTAEPTQTEDSRLARRDKLAAHLVEQAKVLTLEEYAAVSVATLIRLPHTEAVAMLASLIHEKARGCC